jgi:hypothetical protein
VIVTPLFFIVRIYVRLSLVVFGIIVGFLIDLLFSSTPCAYWSSISLPAGLAVQRCFTGHSGRWSAVFLNWYPLSLYHFFMPSSLFLKFLLMYSIVGFVVLKLSYQIIRLRDALFVPGVGCATMVVMLLLRHWAISFHMVAFIHQNSKSSPNFLLLPKR